VMYFPIVSIPEPVRGDLNYDFDLYREQVDIYINLDGSIDINYYFNFTNYGDLDGIDIGLPNRHYDEDSATGWVFVNGVYHTPDEIHKSKYISIGMAMEFDFSTRMAIESYGANFQVFFHIRCDRMIYENELKEGGVGIRFRPTWFEPEFQRGPTGEIISRIYFPPTFKEENMASAVWLEERPWESISYDNGTGRVVAVWHDYSVSQYSQEEGNCDVGVGFPKEYVDKYYKYRFREKFMNFMAATKDFCCTMMPCLIPVGIVSLFVGLPAILGWRRSRDYYEPLLSVAGAGPGSSVSTMSMSVSGRPSNLSSFLCLFNNPIILKFLADHLRLIVKRQGIESMIWFLLFFLCSLYSCQQRNNHKSTETL